MTTIHITTPNTAEPAMSLADEQCLWIIARVISEAVFSTTGEVGGPVSREAAIRFAVRFAARVAAGLYPHSGDVELCMDCVTDFAEEIAADVATEEAERRTLRRIAAKLDESLTSVLSPHDLAVLSDMERAA